MSEQDMGRHVTAAGVRVDLDDDEVVTDVLVIAKVVKLGGDDLDDRLPRLVIDHGDTTDWIAVTGLLHAARTVVDRPPERVQDDD